MDTAFHLPGAGGARGERKRIEMVIRVQTLETERNAARATIHWQFTSREARIALVDLYPVKQTERD